MNSRIADILVQSGLITDEQRVSAERIRAAEGKKSLSAQLVLMGVLTEADITKALSTHLGIPMIEIDPYSIDNSLLQVVPPALCQKHRIVPISLHQKKLIVAIADPSDFSVITELKFLTNLDIELRLTPESSIIAGQERLFGSSSHLDELLDSFVDDIQVVTETDQNSDFIEIELPTEDAPVVKLVNAILLDAIQKNVSDIHLEPYEKTFRVRFRIDGILYEVMTPPQKLKNAIISRLKIMASLDIAERRLPQDGRIKLSLGGKKEMDFRVNVLPTLFGEKVVLRLLDKSNLQIDMSKLGLDPIQLSSLKEAISKPHGMVLVTGPTGSGKTTTLYSALTELNKESTNINTAEDPVEFNIPGINQAQVNEDIGLTFAAALRAFLRQDPDVIMVGEIRDYETAEIAIKASLTGHLVLSTLHTNDAPGTINRLLNMGVEPFLVASSLNIIVAQRLARRICLNCKAETSINPEVLVSAGMRAAEAAHMTVYQGEGCSKCSGTGYRGRIALYETMVVTESLRELILHGASAADLKRQAIKEGMTTLRVSGLSRLREGLTTLEEVIRVTASDQGANL
jgi:type IV pilus assembly protein PilB